MTVDPAEPDTFRDGVPEGTDPEAPEADVAEQLAELVPDEDEPVTGVEGARPRTATRRSRRGWCRWTRTTTADQRLRRSVPRENSA